MFEGDPAAFAVFEGDEQISPILTQQQAWSWLERNHGVGPMDARRGRTKFRIGQALDERDTESLTTRQTKRDAMPAVPAEGDVVEFSDGERYRVSYEWTGDNGQRVQTTKGGSFYWGDTGSMSYSGSLISPIAGDTMTLTDETADVPAWFFHHQFACAHNGITVTARVRVWRTTAERPTR